MAAAFGALKVRALADQKFDEIGGELGGVVEEALHVPEVVVMVVLARLAAAHWPFLCLRVGASVEALEQGWLGLGLELGSGGLDQLLFLFGLSLLLLLLRVDEALLLLQVLHVAEIGRAHV